MSPSPESASQLDQAARLRKLVSDARQRSTAKPRRVVLVGATAQSGTMRLFSQLSALAREAPQPGIEIVVSSPGPDAVSARLFGEAAMRTIVVAPEEDEVVAAFATLKAAMQVGIDLAQLMVIVNRCTDSADERFVVNTLRAVCKQHLQANAPRFAAVPEHAGPHRDEVLARLLATFEEASANTRLASSRRWQL